MSALTPAATTCCFLLLLLLTAQQQVSSAQGFDDTAALIVGGLFRPTGAPADFLPQLKTAELFGCPGAAALTVPVADLPETIYLSDAVFHHAGSIDDNYPSGDRVMLCGGYSCDAVACRLRHECHYWRPSEDKWTVGPRLEDVRFNYFFAQLRDRRNPDPDSPAVPLVMGYGTETEIFDVDTYEWKSYDPLPEKYWYGLGCLTQLNGQIYNLRDEVVRLDPETWTTESLGAIPAALARSGRCSPLNLDGEDGIMLKYGYWFGLESREWRKLAAPPLDPLASTPSVDAPNALWSFRGRPTIFGNLECGDDLSCEYSEVVQYDPERDAWVSLGHMSESRTLHTVVEVPASFCEKFNPPTKEPVTTEEPTDGPTGEPTDGPTGEPTDGPTDEPTTEPTTEPSSASAAGVSWRIFAACTVALAIHVFH